MKISVILCTLNPRKDYLDRTLSALRGQTLPVDQWEFLLIDNCSTVPLSETVDLSWHPHARHLREEELGLTPARLRGIQEVRSETLVFVDDDVVLAKDYLEEALAVSERHPFIGVWGGNIVPEFEIPPPAWCGQEIWRLTIAEVKKDIWSNLREGFTTIPAGAGMCIRASVGLHFLKLCSTNRISRGLDRTGTALSGYGDVDLAHCAMDIGMGTGKFACLSLTHLIPDSRLTLDYFLRHAEGDGASLMMFRAIRGLPISKPKTSFLIRVKRRLYWLLTRTGSEEIQIALAHERGINKGWQMAQEYLQTKALIS